MFQKVKKAIDQKAISTYVKAKALIKQKAEDFITWLVRPNQTRANAGAVGTIEMLILIIIVIVIGALVLVFLKEFFNVDILPSIGNKIKAMFN